MQTNREDCGQRYREIILPRPKSKEWARTTSAPFRNYFETIANARTTFIEAVRTSKFEHVANVISSIPVEDADERTDDEA
jgi:type I restriction enzyme M protein